MSMRQRGVVAAALSLALSTGAAPAHASPATPAAQASPSTPAAHASPAVSTGACTVVGPGTVSVGAPRQRVTYRLGAHCPTGGSASWALVRPGNGRLATLVFAPGRRTADLTVRDTMPPGTAVLRPTGAAAQGEPVGQAGRPVVLKARSRAAVSVQRTGDVVALRATVAHYRLGRNRYVPWRNAAVHFQRRTCPTCEWRQTPQGRTDAGGRASVGVRVNSAAAADWRVVVGGTSTIWPSSSSVRRG